MCTARRDCLPCERLRVTFFFFLPILVIVSHGKLGQTEEAIVPNTTKDNEGKFPCVPRAQRLSGNITCCPEEVIRICALPPYRLHLYGGSRTCRCAVHIIIRADCTLSPDGSPCHCQSRFATSHYSPPQGGFAFINGGGLMVPCADSLLLFVRCQVRWLQASRHGNPCLF